MVVSIFSIRLEHVSFEEILTVSSPLVNSRTTIFPDFSILDNLELYTHWKKKLFFANGKVSPKILLLINIPQHMKVTWNSHPYGSQVNHAKVIKSTGLSSHLHSKSKVSGDQSVSSFWAAVCGWKTDGEFSSYGALAKVEPRRLMLPSLEEKWNKHCLVFK